MIITLENSVMLGNNIDDMCNGQTPSRYNDNYRNDSINWLSSGELNRDIVTDTIEKITGLGKEAARLKFIKKGTMIIVLTGL